MYNSTIILYIMHVHLQTCVMYLYKVSNHISLGITAELDAVTSTDDTKNPVYDPTITTPDESKPGSL